MLKVMTLFKKPIPWNIILSSIFILFDVIKFISENVFAQLQILQKVKGKRIFLKVISKQTTNRYLLEAYRAFISKKKTTKLP